MTKPTVGQFVHWFSHADKKNVPVTAVVTRVEVGAGAVCQLTLFRCQGTPEHRTNVYHISDPRLETNDFIAKEYGAWDWMPETLEREALKQEVAKLRADLTQLVDELTKKKK